MTAEQQPMARLVEGESSARLRSPEAERVYWAGVPSSTPVPFGVGCACGVFTAAAHLRRPAEA